MIWLRSEPGGVLRIAFGAFYPELFSEYCAQVHAIIQLRYFAKLRLYELVEIPVESLFGQIMNLSKSEFAADGPTIDVPPGSERPDFTLKIDRSDSKITIANINKDVCITHGSWRLESWAGTSFLTYRKGAGGE